MGIFQDGLRMPHFLRAFEGDEMYKYTHETVVDSDIKSTFDWFEHEGSVSYTHLRAHET